MSDINIVKGGLPTATTNLVTVDRVTIDGDGTALHPLHVIPGSSNPVAVDNVSIAGNGTPGLPLHTIAGGTAVATDATLTGNGTTAHPLHAVQPGAGSVAVVADNVSILGNGTAANPLHTAEGHTVVIADGTSISGLGTNSSPLQTIAGGTGVVTDLTLNGNGTTGNPLHAVLPDPGTVAVVTNNTMVGDGTTARPLGVNIGNIPIAADGGTITGDGTTTNALRVVQNPISIHGAAFTSGNDGNPFTIGLNGYTNNAETASSAFYALTIPVNYLIHTVSVQVVDAAGTQLTASLQEIPPGSETPISDGVSAPSLGNGTLQNLNIPLPAAPINVLAGRAFIIQVTPSTFATSGWRIQKASIT